MIDSTVELVCYTLSGRVPIRSYILHNPQQNCIHLHVIALNTQHFICSAHPPTPSTSSLWVRMWIFIACALFLFGWWANGPRAFISVWCGHNAEHISTSQINAACNNATEQHDFDRQNRNIWRKCSNNCTINWANINFARYYMKFWYIFAGKRTWIAYVYIFPSIRTKHSNIHSFPIIIMIFIGMVMGP